MLSRFQLPDIPDEGPAENGPHAGLDNNPCKDGRLFSDTHPYIAGAYKGAKKVVERFVKQLEEKDKYEPDRKFGERLQISTAADKTELKENIRAAKVLLSSFTDMTVKIRPHILVHGRKNPEYEIDGFIADRKGIESEKGIASAFKKAIGQGCEIVVIDIDAKMQRLNVKRLAGHIYWRKRDFENGTIKACYVISAGKSVKIDKAADTKEKIMKILEKLKP